MKKLLVIAILFFITGCSAEYTLDISQEAVKETLLFDNSDNTLDSNLLFYLPAFYDEYGATDEIRKIPGVEYYNEIYRSTEFGYSYTFNINDFNESKILNSCYEVVNISSDEYSLKITTNNHMKCYEDDINDLTIRISNNNNIISSNATFKNSDYHIWQFNANSIYDAQITFEYQFKERPNIPVEPEDEDDVTIPSEPEEEMTPFQTTLIILGSITAFIIILVILIKIKQKKL